MSKKISQKLQKEIRKIACEYGFEIKFYKNIFTAKDRDIFKQKINWDNIAVKFVISEEFIREFADNINWTWLAFDQRLSEKIIREFADKLYWKDICFLQILSESVIREFQNKIDWNYISQYQKLSEEFILEFADKINFTSLLSNDNIHESVKEKCALMYRTIHL